MPPTLLPGPETSVQNIDNNVRGMDANVYELKPSVAPLVALSDSIGSTAADNPKVEWMEDESMPRITTLTASATNVVTSWTVTNDIFRVGDVVRFSAGGWGLLLTATAAGSIQGTVIGSQASAAAGAELYLVSNANAEGATLREIKINQLVTQFNYCEIVRTPFGVTTTEMGVQHYGGEERTRLRKKFGIEHARSIENICFFGLRSINGTTRTAGGLLSYITTNVSVNTSTLTEDDWQAFLRQAFRYGSERKTVFASPAVVGSVEGFARGNLRVVDSAGEKYGITMKQYVSGQGVVDIVMHRDWLDSAVYGGYAFMVDMDSVRLRPLRNVGSTRLLPNRQANDYDGVKDEYRSETCLQVQHERRHALLTGVTAPAIT
jgi:hypothetical protein